MELYVEDSSVVYPPIPIVLQDVIVPLEARNVIQPLTVRSEPALTIGTK